MTEKIKLIDVILDHKGKLIDKWEQYIGVYELELAKFIDAGRPVRLLEIGVQNGGSLELWKKLLPPGSEIRGLDIDPRVTALEFEPGVRADIADATDAKQLDAALGEETFDIIIDDGSHRCADVRQTFMYLFPRVRPGGHYFIEDLHCSYYASFGGGLRESTSSTEFIKSFVDCLHFEYIDTASIESDEAAKLELYNRVLAKIAFYDSIAVISKLEATKSAPYRRIISGSAAPIQPISAWIRTYPVTLLQQLIFGNAAVRQFEEALFEELEEKRTAADRLGKQVAALEAEIARLNRLGFPGG